MYRPFRAALTIALALSIFINPADSSACTGITLRPRDGSVIYARTLEFAADLKSNLIVVPRGQQFTGTTPAGEPGLRWTTRYASTGMNAFGLPLFIDGLNERGLAVGVFYFPGYADYQKTTAADNARTLAPQELGAYLLGTCANVAEATSAVHDVLVAAVPFAQLGEVPPCHFLVSDAAGNSLVVEYVGGELRLHNNPLGVFTNSPTFDWHLTNLSNYVNLSVTNVPPLDVDGTRFRGLGQGTGMLGLPGDFTPPSRFVRAVAFAKSALPVDTAREGVLQAFHILNQFDIPKGAARGVEQGQTVADYTLWTSAADLTNRRYYFRTFANSRIRMLDLSAIDAEAVRVLTIDISGEEEIENVTPTVK